MSQQQSPRTMRRNLRSKGAADMPEGVQGRKRTNRRNVKRATKPKTKAKPEVDTAAPVADPAVVAEVTKLVGEQKAEREAFEKAGRDNAASTAAADQGPDGPMDDTGDEPVPSVAEKLARQEALRTDAANNGDTYGVAVADAHIANLCQQDGAGGDEHLGDLGFDLASLPNSQQQDESMDFFRDPDFLKNACREDEDEDTSTPPAKQAKAPGEVIAGVSAMVTQPDTATLEPVPPPVVETVAPVTTTTTTKTVVKRKKPKKKVPVAIDTTVLAKADNPLSDLLRQSIHDYDVSMEYDAALTSFKAECKFKRIYKMAVMDTPVFLDSLSDGYFMATVALLDAAYLYKARQILVVELHRAWLQNPALSDALPNPFAGTMTTLAKALWEQNLDLGPVSKYLLVMFSGKDAAQALFTGRAIRDPVVAAHCTPQYVFGQGVPAELLAAFNIPAKDSLRHSGGKDSTTTAQYVIGVAHSVRSSKGLEPLAEDLAEVIRELDSADDDDENLLDLFENHSKVLGVLRGLSVDQLIKELNERKYSNILAALTQIFAPIFTSTVDIGVNVQVSLNDIQKTFARSDHAELDWTKVHKDIRLWPIVVYLGAHDVFQMFFRELFYESGFSTDVLMVLFISMLGLRKDKVKTRSVARATAKAQEAKAMHGVYTVSEADNYMLPPLEWDAKGKLTLDEHTNMIRDIRGQLVDLLRNADNDIDRTFIRIRLQDVKNELACLVKRQQRRAKDATKSRRLVLSSDESDDDDMQTAPDAALNAALVPVAPVAAPANQVVTDLAIADQPTNSSIAAVTQAFETATWLNNQEKLQFLNRTAASSALQGIAGALATAMGDQVRKTFDLDKPDGQS